MAIESWATTWHVGLTGNKTAETSSSFAVFSVSGSWPMPSGTVVVLVLGADNAGTSGVSSFSSVGQPSSGAITWNTPRVVNRTAGSAANDGCTLIVAVGEVTSAINKDSTLSVSWSPSTTAKAAALAALKQATTTEVDFQSATGTGTSPTVTTGSSPVRGVQSGDAVIGVVAVESNTPVTTDDTDTLNGSWSAQNLVPPAQSGGSGGDATKMSCAFGVKVVTADGAQTFDPTVTNTDRAIAVVTLAPKVYSIVPPSRSRRFQHMLVR